MSESKEYTVHFTVCGEGLTDLVREMYCFEDNREGAFCILSSLDGITEEQMISVCTGDAHITGMDVNGNMGYVEKPDWAFKKEYHKFLLRREVRARKIKEAEEAERKEIEAAAEKNHISPDTQRWVNEQNPYHDQVRREHLSRLSRRGQQIPPPSKETIKVGKWDVPKNYLDRYAGHVVKRIRGLIRMQCAGIASIDTLDPIGTYNLEMERQELHNAICDAIGVPHSEIGKERTQDQADFDEALDKYLDKHAGSLFNGGGD